MLLEKTQRRLCRLLFVAGCVLPTLAVAGFTSSRRCPGYTDDLLGAVGDRLGATVRCDRLTTPRPGVFELDGVVVTDRATGREFLTCQNVRVCWGLQRYEFSATRVSMRRPGDAWALRLLESDLIVRGEVASLSLDGSDEITRADLSLDGAADGARRLRLAAASAGRLEATLSGGVCSVELDAPENTIAVDWLPAPPLAAINAKGCRFSGKVSAEVPVDGGPATGTLAGRLTLRKLALNGLESARGGVDLSEFHWTGERIERLAGRIDLREGRLSRSVVYGMCRWLAMEPFDALERQWDDKGRSWFDFTQLACEVELDKQGLVLVAGCGEMDGHPRGGAVAHSVVEHDGEALLREPTQRPLPTQRLVQAWRPDDLAELPATAAAIEMAGRLPGLGAR